MLWDRIWVWETQFLCHYSGLTRPQAPCGWVSRTAAWERKCVICGSFWLDLTPPQQNDIPLLRMDLLQGVTHNDSTLTPIGIITPIVNIKNDPKFYFFGYKNEAKRHFDIHPGVKVVKLIARSMQKRLQKKRCLDVRWLVRINDDNERLDNRRQLPRGVLSGSDRYIPEVKD